MLFRYYTAVSLSLLMTLSIHCADHSESCDLDPESLGASSSLEIHKPTPTKKKKKKKKKKKAASTPTATTVAPATAPVTATNTSAHKQDFRPAITILHRMIKTLQDHHASRTGAFEYVVIDGRNIVCVDMHALIRLPAPYTTIKKWVIAQVQTLPILKRYTKTKGATEKFCTIISEIITDTVKKIDKGESLVNTIAGDLIDEYLEQSIAGFNVVFDAQAGINIRQEHVSVDAYVEKTLKEKMIYSELRHAWTIDEVIKKIQTYDLPKVA